MLKLNLIIILCLTLVVDNISANNSNNDFSRDPRIINGTDASSKLTSHQVSVRRCLDDSRKFGSGHFCGGSLISENVVLSAAHCFINSTKGDGSFLPETDFIVAMGNLNRSEFNNNSLIFNITKIVKRAEYFNLITLADDIVLLILSGTVPAKHPTVKPIILNEGPIRNNTICQATGWGVTENKRISEKLRTVDLPLIDFNDCRNKTKYGNSILEGMLCAGYLEGGRDSCTADSGGPLVCRGIQAGIISWGNGCAQPLNPGVFTDVSYYKNWILKEVAHYNGTLPKFAFVRGGSTNLSDSVFLISLILIFNFLSTQLK